ncbi:class E sortase [Angustibacter sp. McL0619]|uniref:class E sortase n=1 Tax=Angustibacter sp. McL0619 TaxID=3415676 RepID=UPI003CE73927
MNALRATLRGFGEICITAGLVLLLFVVWQLWWTDVTAAHAQSQQTEQLQKEWADLPPHPSPSSTATPTSPATPTKLKEIPLGDAFALIRVPRFGHGYVRPIIEGTSLDVLDRGVGHYADSAKPGAVGNFAVAGHRVTYAKPFNRIDELKVGDPVVVETADTWYVYRVVGHEVVTPDRVDVVAPVPEHPGQKPTERMMTMTACHPKFSARQRYVVFSKLEQKIAKSPGVVPDVLRG